MDAGDVMMAQDHYFIGLSQRTTAAGAKQLMAILHRYGLSASTVELNDVLHLKTGVVYLDKGIVVTAGEFNEKSEFATYQRLVVSQEEAYAANCVWINGRVLVAKGYPRIQRQVEEAGFEAVVLDMSEFRKLDGGLSCLSLRF